MYAPIIIFVYNRVDRVKQLVESLSKNLEAKDSELYIFSDGAKSESGMQRVEEVRDYVEGIPKMGLFKNVFIDKAIKNRGLAESIIYGVSRVMNQFGKAIIIEDDNMVAPDFLDYMNRGLDFYENDSSVWAIGGFSRNMKFPIDYKYDVFCAQRISSYTWASWKDRWDKTEWNIEKYYPEFLWNRIARKKFDEWGEDRSLMLDAQMCGTISSWAIRFEYTMVQNDMYCVLPCISKAECSGNDGSGTHGDKVIHDFDTKMSDGSKRVKFEKVEPDERIRQEFIKPYMRKWKRKIFGNIDFKVLYYKKYKDKKNEFNK